MKTSPFPRGWMWAGLALAVIGWAAFLFITPGGVLRKTDYVAAAVCHRRPEHSFFVGDQQLPLCQRCSGTFPGALTGLLVQWLLWRRRRALRFPHWRFLLLMAALAAPWALDGVNSLTSELPWREAGVGVLGYAPQPWLRLLTGILMGAAMSVFLAPAFNQTMWADGVEEPTVRSWREFALLSAIELAVGVVIYLAEPILLYPVAIYSALAVVALFTCLGAMIFVMALARDGTLHSWREAWVPLAWGLVFALLVIGGMDVVRFQLLGTIDGMPGIS